MKGCVQWNRVYGLKDFGFQGESNKEPIDQWANLNPFELPGLLNRLEAKWMSTLP